MRGALCIPDAQGVNPGLILSPTTAAASCIRSRRRGAERSETNTVHPHYARRSGPGVGSSLARLSGSQGLTSTAGTSWPARGHQPAPAPNLNCQRLRLEPVLQRTSGTPHINADSVTVELGLVQSGGPEGAPAPMPFGSHTIEVAEASAPALGTLVTLTFALQA